MNVMDFRKVDSLLPFQLEVGDFINVNSDIVSIVEISPLDESYAIFYLDAFEEKEFIEIDENSLVDIYLPD